MYAPLFDAVRGMRWVLSAVPASVAPPGPGASGNSGALPLVNVFAPVAGSADEVIVPLMLGGGGGAAAALTVRHRVPGRAYAVDALYPGGAWKPVVASARAGEDGSLNAGTVALQDGCALVRVRPCTGTAYGYPGTSSAILL